MKRSPWIKATMKARKELGIKKKFVLINGPSKLGKKLYKKSLSHYKSKSPKRKSPKSKSPKRKTKTKRLKHTSPRMKSPRMKSPRVKSNRKRRRSPKRN